MYVPRKVRLTRRNQSASATLLIKYFRMHIRTLRLYVKFILTGNLDEHTSVDKKTLARDSNTETQIVSRANQFRPKVNKT